MSLRSLRRLARSKPNPVRIGFLRIAHETNAWNPVRTEVEDFRSTHFVEGDALLAACRPGASEVDGYVRNAELSGVLRALEACEATPVPLISLWGIPSGPLSEEALGEMASRVRTHLEAAGPLDGLVVVMHGAMTSERGHLAEAELLAGIRAQLGADLPIVLTLDLHAHLSPPKLDPVDAVLAYQTNPHRDHAAVGEKAGLLAVALARRAVRIEQAWRMLPMIAGGGTTLDFLPTMLPVFLRLWRIDRRPEVVHASLFMSHLWHDAPDLGWSTCVVTDAARDPGGHAAARHADRLADALWSVRSVRPPRFLSTEEMIALARRSRWSRRLGVIAVSDASDNIAAGGHGANTNIVRELIEHGRGLLSYVPLGDRDAVDRLAAVAPGESVRLSLGGNVDPERCPAIEVAGRLRHRTTHPALGRMVVLDLDHVQLVLTDRPPLAIKPDFYRDVGLDPLRADIHVLKSFFHFRWYYRWIARKVLYVQTRGITDLDLPYEQDFAFPVYPQVELDDWRPEDLRRRGVDR